MKFSELTTEQALDVICEITPVVSDIVTDEELSTELKRKIGINEKMTRADIIAIGLEKISALSNILFNKKREAIFSILAAVNLAEIEKVKKQNLMLTLKQIRELAEDKVFWDFVKSCKRTEKSE